MAMRGSGGGRRRETGSTPLCATRAHRGGRRGCCAAAVNTRARLLALGAALAAVLSAGAAAAQAPAAADGGAWRGYLAVRAVDGGALQVLDAHNADRLFVPASVLKVVTVAAALEHLGPDYRWRTRLTASGAADDGGVLAGDLVIEPGADPTWGAFFEDGAAGPLAELAAQVRTAGVTRIRGDLVVNAGRFPGRPHPLDRAFGDLPYRHGTPAAGLAVDEATVTVRVAPGSTPGAPGRAEAPDGIDLINRTTTVGRDRHGAGNLDFLPLWGTDTLLLRGEYPISESSFAVPASDPAPAARAARRLAAALADAGVAVEGAVRVERRPPDDTVLAELRSPPLAALLPEILTESHNWYAETLALTLGLEVAGTGRFDDGVEVIADFAAELAAAGDAAHGPPAPELRDGSGLSPANLIAPAVVVRVLAHAAGRPWRDTFLAAMAGPGEGTLEAWPRLPQLAAKTGSLRHTVTLAGIVDPDGDAPVLFCYFVNHDPRPRPEARGEIAAAVRRWRSAAAAR